MSPTRGLYINRIFGTGGRNRGLLHPLHASARYCSASGNGALSLCQTIDQMVKPVGLDQGLWFTGLQHDKLIVVDNVL